MPVGLPDKSDWMPSHVDVREDRFILYGDATKMVGTFVYRVNDDETVSVRPVQLGPVQGETTVIEQGLVPGERVVTDGADKLRDGAKIEAIVPGAEASAQPPGAHGNAAARGNAQAGGQGRRNRVATDGQ